MIEENEYELVRAIPDTEGAQCEYWKGQLKELVMKSVLSFGDACAELGHGGKSEQIINRQGEVERLLLMVFDLIPTDKNRYGGGDTQNE